MSKDGREKACESGKKSIANKPYGGVYKYSDLGLFTPYA